MTDTKLWKLILCSAITLQCLTTSLAEVEGECSSRCWSPGKTNFGSDGTTKQDGVSNERDCRVLCLNTETCIAIDWDKTNKECGLHMTTLSSDFKSNVNHWSVTNCADKCSAFCWRPVKIVRRVSGDNRPSGDIEDESHCKLLCSNKLNCTGIDWYESKCYLLYTAELPDTDASEARHWDIERNLPTSCQAQSTESSTYTPTVTTTTSSTVSTASSTLTPLESSTGQSEDGIIGRSDNLRAGVIVLAVLMGLGIFIIIGLVFNTIRIGRKLHQKGDMRTVELDVNYEHLRKVDSNVTSDDQIYMNIPKMTP